MSSTVARNAWPVRASDGPRRRRCRLLRPPCAAGFCFSEACQAANDRQFLAVVGGLAVASIASVASVVSSRQSAEEAEVADAEDRALRDKRGEATLRAEGYTTYRVLVDGDEGRGGGAAIGDVERAGVVHGDGWSTVRVSTGPVGNAEPATYWFDRRRGRLPPEARRSMIGKRGGDDREHAAAPARALRCHRGVNFRSPRCDGPSRLGGLPCFPTILLPLPPLPLHRASWSSP